MFDYHYNLLRSTDFTISVRHDCVEFVLTRFNVSPVTSQWSTEALVIIGTDHFVVSEDFSLYNLRVRRRCPMTSGGSKYQIGYLKCLIVTQGLNVFAIKP